MKRAITWPGPLCALEQLACAADHIGLMVDSSFQAVGHRQSLTNEINQIIKFIQKGNLSQATKQLATLIERTDGCDLRGAPDPMGGGQTFAGDHVVACDDQEVVFGCLSDALNAID